MSKSKVFNSFNDSAKDNPFSTLVSGFEPVSGKPFQKGRVDVPVDDNRPVLGTVEVDPALARMREELDELTERVVKLHAFRSGAKPEHISLTQWDLLLTQLHAMRIYQTTLITRCRLFGQNDD